MPTDDAPTAKEVSRVFIWARNLFVGGVVIGGAIFSVIGWYGNWREHREAIEDARTRAIVTEMITPYVNSFSISVGAHDALIKFIMDNDSSWGDFAVWKQGQECKDLLLRGEPCRRK